MADWDTTFKAIGRELVLSTTARLCASSAVKAPVSWTDWLIASLIVATLFTFPSMTTARDSPLCLEVKE